MSEPGSPAAPTTRVLSRRALHDIDWHEAIGAVVWIPEAHRNPTVPASTAMRILRCTNESFDQLLDLGLPATTTLEGKFFDPFDLKNVALYSGTGVTEVEVAMRLLLRYMSSAPDDLTRHRRWKFQIRLSSPGASGGSEAAGEPRARRVHRPVQEVFGGTLSLLDETEHETDYLMIRPGEAVSGLLETRGALDPVRSPGIRRAMTDLTESGVRWHYLPTSLEVLPDDALALGIGNCAVLCNLLERRLVEDGYDAAAYHGWLVEVPYTEHGWVEVVDEDGRTKCLDPSFGLLATKNGFGTPEFGEFTVGSWLNRIVPTRARLHHPLVSDAADPNETAIFIGEPSDRARAERAARGEDASRVAATSASPRGNGRAS